MPRAIKYSIFFKPTAAAVLSFLATIAACNGSGSEEGSAEQALTAVEGAKVSCGDLQENVGPCLDTLKTCLDEAGREDVDACFAELEQCAPIAPPPVGEGAGQPPPEGAPPPPPPPPGGGGGGQPPPPPPGGADEPTPTLPGGGGHGHGDCPKGGKGGGHHAPPPDPCVAGGVSFDACLDELKACAEANADRAPCLEDAAACIGDIVEQTFQGFCEEQLAACAEGDRADDEKCAEIEAHCADGVPPALPADTDLP